ncbi:MAG TPA: phosphatidylinositol-specific phospholipase C/glycerophosphodiester phosphodiesterase family protein [Mucilaginibacter sp.]|nr:phosphatidylinositol-specific phospholipase C/glycerophosphodiester phosphodiesterase family protein [Mucilaginibacter sp.]
MRSAILSVKLLKTAFFVVFLFSPLIVRSQSVPLPHAFAHNDYFHKRPLFDALDNGYTNIEADIFLENDELIVAHINPFFKSDRTLEALYLKPLAEHIEKNDGQVYKGYNEPVILMIDIKTGAENTYRRLKILLQKYRAILSRYDHGNVVRKAVTIVLSGHKPFRLVREEDDRMAFIDEDLRKTSQDTSSANVYKLASCKYSKLLSWNGEGQMPAAEKARLCAYVEMAHRFGKKVRLWASPEKRNVWDQLLDCGVDLINTDKLEELRDFLLARAEKEHKYDNADLMITSNTAR